MRRFLWTLIGVLMFTTHLSSESPADYYVAGMDAAFISNSVILTWYSDAENGDFKLAFSSNSAISTPEIFKEISFFTNAQLKGKKKIESDSLFQFRFEWVSFPSGKWYTAILPNKPNLLPDDFSPQQSYTVTPFQLTATDLSQNAAATNTGIAVSAPLQEVTNTNQPGIPSVTHGENPVSNTSMESTNETLPQNVLPSIVVTNITGPVVIKISFSTNGGLSRMSWVMPPNDSPDLKFTIYRTFQPIRDLSELGTLTPYRVIWNDYLVEESAPVRGTSWVYTILVNDYAVILPGSNQVRYPEEIKPASVPVIREVYERTRINTNTYRPKAR